MSSQPGREDKRRPKAVAVSRSPWLGVQRHAATGESGDLRAGEIATVYPQVGQRPVLSDRLDQGRDDGMLGFIRVARQRVDDQIWGAQFDDVPLVPGERATTTLAPMAHLRITEGPLTPAGDVAQNPSTARRGIWLKVLRQHRLSGGEAVCSAGLACVGPVAPRPTPPRARRRGASAPTPPPARRCHPSRYRALLSGWTDPPRLRASAANVISSLAPIGDDRFEGRSWTAGPARELTLARRGPAYGWSVDSR